MRIFHLFYVKALLACGVSSFLRHFWFRKWNVNIITLSPPFSLVLFLTVQVKKNPMNQKIMHVYLRSFGSQNEKKEIGHTICSYNIFFAFWCSGYFMSILKIIFQANWLQNVVPDNIFQIVAMDHFYSLLFWTIFCPILQIPFPDNIFGQTAVMDNIFANCRCEWVTCKFWRLSFKSSL